MSTDTENRARKCFRNLRQLRRSKPRRDFRGNPWAYARSRNACQFRRVRLPVGGDPDFFGCGLNSLRTSGKAFCATTILKQSKQRLQTRPIQNVFVERSKCISKACPRGGRDIAESLK